MAREWASATVPHGWEWATLPPPVASDVPGPAPFLVAPAHLSRGELRDPEKGAVGSLELACHALHALPELQARCLSPHPPRNHGDLPLQLPRRLRPARSHLHAPLLHRHLLQGLRTVEELGRPEEAYAALVRAMGAEANLHQAVVIDATRRRKEYDLKDGRTQLVRPLPPPSRRPSPPSTSP